MKAIKILGKIKIYLAVTVVLTATGVALYLSNNSNNKTFAAGTPSSSTPCAGNAAPAQWKHVVVLMFENKTYTQVINAKDASNNLVAPYITDLVNKCGTSYSGTAGATPKNNWHDSNYKVDGSTDGSYVSKPSYATLTSGVSPTTHGLINDTYSTTSSVDNIYNRLNLAGKDAKNYYSGTASSTPCVGSNFSGAYHDAIRYFTNLGGQSSSTSTYCNTHDKPLSTFMTDVNAGNLPAFSMILPTNSENMHDNSIPSGDTWANNFLTPLFDSAQYKSGDTAVFFIWDEDTGIPNVLIAPSIVPGSKVAAPSGNPISHFAGLRTIQEMLGITPLLGDTGSAPSLLAFFNGGSVVTPPPPPPVDNPPTVSLTAPTNGATLTTSPATVSANATDDIGVSKVEFYDGTTLLNSDTSSPYSYSWDLTGLSGSHTLTAKAYDSGGHITTSSAVSVTISLSQACQTIPTTYGSVTSTVSIPTTTTYHIWSRIMAPDTTNNSYYLQVDSNCAINVGDAASIAANSWTWLDYQDGSTATHTSANLTAGTHNITLIGREPGAKLDRVLFVSDTCVPTGIGGNCADSTAPTVSLTSPTANQTVSGTTTLSATAADDSGGSGVAKVDFLVDGVVKNSDTTSPYSYSWDSKTVADGTHTVQAKATDVAGNIGSSITVSVTVKNADTTAPSAPTNLATTKNVYNEVDLSWTASTDNVGVTNYQVFRNNISIATLGGTVTTYKDTSVTANTSYTYTVKAADAASNTSAASNALSITTPAAPDTTAPSTPTNLATTKNSYNEVDLSWTASTDNVGVTGYRVLRGGVVIATVATTTYNDTTVLANTSYTYTVVAYDAAGNPSANSNAVTITTPNVPDTTPPSAPTGLTATPGATQIDLSWTASTDTVGVAGYDVFRNSAKIATVTTTSFGDATVVAGTTYSYYVIAFDAAGNRSASSNVVTATNNSTPPPIKAGDISQDSKVDITDLSYLLSSYGQNTTQCITNTAYKCDLSTPSDNKVDIFDLSILLSNYGK
jgi:fibronectin type 3 domain-containing protein